jgi:DNA-binding transcriptional MocR family regulator
LARHAIPQAWAARFERDHWTDSPSGPRAVNGVVMQWKPRLTGAGSLHERVIAALERDVRNGTIKNGTRLPAQRQLADHLGLSVGTITKAYLEAERRGLVRGHVGRGTYVTSVFGELNPSETFEGQLIDLSTNVVPHNAAVPYFIDYRANTLRHWEAFEALSYCPPAGPDDQRKASAVWLKRVANYEADWTRLILTNGAQQAIALALDHLANSGDTILCEGATFFGVKTLAEFRGYRLHGLALDEEGIVPQELEKACKLSKAKILYLMPSVQNPTGRTMGKARRQAIAKIAQKYKLWIIEDDVYAIFRDPKHAGLIPIASILPEQTFYVASISKILAPGLRLGFLVCPSERAFEAVTGALRATVLAPSSLGGLLFSRWVEDGSGFKIADRVVEEINGRIGLAREILGACLVPPMTAPHIWLSLPQFEAEQICERALRAGLAITSPDSPIVPGSNISGLRICLGMASNRSQLAVGLRRFRDSLFQKPKLAGSLV